jgi:hypothetical protein
MQPPPEHLYKYAPFSSQSLKNLKDQVLYFNSPAGFNDPYDCALPATITELSDEEVEKVRHFHLAKSDLPPMPRKDLECLSTPDLKVRLLELAKGVLNKCANKFADEKGFSCFTEKKDNLLMWSHYADRQRGFCLEFSTKAEPFTKIRPVEYKDSMPQLRSVDILCGIDNDDFLNLFFTKSSEWAYERGWRCIHNNVRTVYGYAAETLVGVYMGPKSTDTEFEIIALILAGQNTHVKLWKGRQSKTQFAVEFEPITYTPYLEAKRSGLI